MHESKLYEVCEKVLALCREKGELSFTEIERIALAEEIRPSAVIDDLAISVDITVDYAQGKVICREGNARSEAAEQTRAVSEAHDRLSSYKRPNSAAAESILDDLEEKGLDVGNARDALESYTELAREDFDSAEEYRDERASAWDEFVNAVGDIEVEEEY